MYFPPGTAIVALGTEVLVFLSLMEMLPFGKGGSDIIWALLFRIPRGTQRETQPNTSRKFGYRERLTKRYQPAYSHSGARFSSGSPRYFGWSLAESLNQP